VDPFPAELFTRRIKYKSVKCGDMRGAFYTLQQSRPVITAAIIGIAVKNPR
jgi:hypothetical protein